MSPTFTTERRRSRRYPVSADRAEITVIRGRKKLAASLTDMSAEGFGFLISRDAQLEAGQSIRLIFENSTFECTVIHARVSDNALLAGVHYVSEVAADNAMIPRRRRRFFRESVGVTAPLTVLMVLSAIGGVMLSSVGIVDGWFRPRPVSALTAGISGAAPPFEDEYVDEQSEPVTEDEQHPNVPDSPVGRLVSFLFDGELPEDVAEDNESKKWERIADELELTPEQQAEMLETFAEAEAAQEIEADVDEKDEDVGDAAEEPVDDEDAEFPDEQNGQRQLIQVAARERILGSLTSEQRSRFTEMLAASPARLRVR